MTGFYMRATLTLNGLTWNIPKFQKLYIQGENKPVLLT